MSCSPGPALDFRIRGAGHGDAAALADIYNPYVLETTITFENIQNVTVQQGPLQRLFGIADVRVDTAGGGGGGPHSQHGGGASMVYV